MRIHGGSAAIEAAGESIEAEEADGGVAAVLNSSLMNKYGKALGRSPPPPPPLARALSRVRACACVRACASVRARAFRPASACAPVRAYARARVHAGARARARPDACSRARGLLNLAVTNQRGQAPGGLGRLLFISEHPLPPNACRAGSSAAGPFRKRAGVAAGWEEGGLLATQARGRNGQLGNPGPLPRVEHGRCRHVRAVGGAGRLLEATRRLGDKPPRAIRGAGVAAAAVSEFRRRFRSGRRFGGRRPCAHFP